MLSDNRSMPAVDWEHISSDKAEDVISMLLNHLWPDRAERLDGSGGDGGRDVQVRLEDGLHAHEIKGFTGRVDHTQRTQIKRSLLRATRLNPVDWSLHVPIDHTPGELQWFENTLQPLVNFPIYWRGRTWLDTELAQRPMIERYYFGDAYREARNLLELARAEEAALARGAVDALERVERLSTQLNELDPFYEWEISSDGTSSRLRGRPRYPGADVDYRLRASMQFAFPDTPAAREAAEQFQRSIEFGTPVTLPEPYITRFDHNVLVLPQFESPPQRIEIGPAEPDRIEEVVLVVIDPSGLDMAELRFTGTATAGTRGKILDAADSTGSVRIHFVVDRQEQRATINFTTTIDNPFEPAEMRKAVRFLEALVAPNRLEVRVPDGPTLDIGPMQATDSLASPGFGRLLDDLTLVQWAAGRSHHVGPELTRDDARAIGLGSKLVRGQPISGTWDSMNFDLRDDLPETQRAVYAQQEFRLAYTSRDPFTVTIAGHDYRLGRGRLVAIESAKLAPELEDWLGGSIPAGATIRVVPAVSNVIQLWLLGDDVNLSIFASAEPVDRDQPEVPAE